MRMCIYHPSYLSVYLYSLIYLYVSLYPSSLFPLSILSVSLILSVSVWSCLVPALRQINELTYPQLSALLDALQALINGFYTICGPIKSLEARLSV